MINRPLARIIHERSSGPSKGAVQGFLGLDDVVNDALPVDQAILSRYSDGPFTEGVFILG